MKSALFIILTDSPGGAERVAITLANRLSQRTGWSVELLIMGKRNEASFVDNVAAPGVVRSFGRFERERLSFTTLPFRLVCRAQDLVFTTHVHTNALTSLMTNLGAMRPGRLVSRESTTVFDRFSGFKRFAFQCLYRLYGAQDATIAQTRYMADHVVPRLPSMARKAVCVLPNPVDVEAINRAADEPLADSLAARLLKRTSILVCGRLIQVKQPLLSLETFSLLLGKSRRDLQLVFMGDGPMRAEVEEAARVKGLADRVVFLGRQANPYPIMRACHYGLLTSSREGFPNVVLEMMACGLRKVVMTPCAGDLDTLTGVTVTQGFSAEEIAVALNDAIIADEDLRDTYREVVAARSVEKYLDAVLGISAYAR